MFFGEYLHRVDEKGRVIVPQKFREELGVKFIVTKGLDKCLFVYPMDEWKRIVEKLKEKPFTSNEVRLFSRFLFSGATECEVDKQGRILVPINLREYANISKEAYVIGVSTRVEIWNKDNWADYNSEDNMNVEMIAEKMEQLGI